MFNVGGIKKSLKRIALYALAIVSKLRKNIYYINYYYLFIILIIIIIYLI